MLDLGLSGTCLAIVALTASTSGLGCTASGAVQSSATIDGNTQRTNEPTVTDDRALCTMRRDADVAIRETAGPGAFQPNVRRVWRVFGEGGDRRRILVCREIDTNLDGYKDVVRFYNDEGQSKSEEADTNFDGKIDTWNVFAKGRLAEVRLDTNHDGKPDEWKIYVEGKIHRAQRDTNFDGKPDVWEMYRAGHLERIGVDLDGDERVDRWDHDTERRRAIEKKKAKKAEASDSKNKDGKKKSDDTKDDSGDS